MYVQELFGSLKEGALTKREEGFTSRSNSSWASEPTTAFLAAKDVKVSSRSLKVSIRNVSAILSALHFQLCLPANRQVMRLTRLPLVQ